MKLRKSYANGCVLKLAWVVQLRKRNRVRERLDSTCRELIQAARVVIQFRVGELVRIVLAQK